MTTPFNNALIAIINILTIVDIFLIFKNKSEKCYLGHILVAIAHSWGVHYFINNITMLRWMVNSVQNAVTIIATDE